MTAAIGGRGSAADDGSASSQRFVVLRHQMPPTQSRRSHWDLMFQQGDVLRTWAVEELPRAGGPATSGIMLPPHRLAYLDYQGAVSGDRGHVLRYDRGELAWISDTPRQVVIRIRGEHLRGRMHLQRVSERGSADDDRDDAWMIRLSLSDDRGCVSDASW